MGVANNPIFVRFAVTASAIATAVGLTHSIPFLRQRESYILYFGAVMICTWYSGRFIGIASCVCMTLIHNIVICNPGLLIWKGLEDVPAALAFLASGILISLMTARLGYAEEIARKNQQWLQVTLGSIGDAVIATDQLGKIMFMNSTAELITGDPLAKAKSSHISGVFRLRELHSDVPCTTPVSLALKEGVTVPTPTSAILRRSDGSEISIDGNASPIKDESGKTIGVVLVFRDIAERERIRKKILEYQEKLRLQSIELALAEERERRSLANGLHDGITQPLGLTRIQLGILRSELSNPDQRRKVDDLSLALKKIISDLGSLTFELSPPILYELGLDAALEWLVQNFQIQNSLRCEFKRSGDQILLRQELRVVLFQFARELLTNIVKHAHAKKAIIHIHRTEKDVALTVSDDGVGCDPESVLTISNHSRGFGIFSIRERTSYMGGEFQMESSPGHGTCIRIALPISGKK